MVLDHVGVSELCFGERDVRLLVEQQHRGIQADVPIARVAAIPTQASGELTQRVKVDGQPYATPNAEPRRTMPAQLIFARVAEVADQTEQAVSRNLLEEAHAGHGCAWNQHRRVIKTCAVLAQDLA